MLSWVAVNALTGDIMADLPNLRMESSLKRTIGRYETQTLVLPLDQAPPNWKAATRKKSAFLVALTDPLQNEPRGRPVWGGLVLGKEPNHGSEVPIQLSTAEDYLQDRFVTDVTYPNWAQNDIVEDLITRYVIPNGIPLRVVKLPGTNPLRERTYTDKDDKSVYEALEELSGVSGGPEWTIEWEWVGEQRLGLVLFVGARIGAAAPVGLGPASWFNLPGNVQGCRLLDGYRRGEGANDVMSTSSGTGDARPQSTHHTHTGDGRPKIEFRWSPSTSITSQSVLESHASKALAGMKSGTVALELYADQSETEPFNLGDDVGFDLTAPAWPKGITGTARVLGVEWTNNTVTPILDVTGIEGMDD